MASTRGLKTFLFTPILTRMARKSGFMLGSVSKPERENTCSTLASYEGVGVRSSKTPLVLISVRRDRVPVPKREYNPSG